MGLEVKDLEPISQGIAEIKGGQAQQVKDLATAQAETKAAKDIADAAKAEAAEAKAKSAELETEVKKLAADAKVTQDAYDKLELKLKRTPLAPEGKEVKSFNQYIAETIERNAETIKQEGSRPLVGSEKKELCFDMFTEEEKKAMTYKSKEGKLETKAVGDMSIGANYPGATPLYQDVRGPLIEQPQNRVWISDLLPQSTSSGTQVVYPKENGLGEGGAAPWTDKTQDKAQMDFDLVPAYSKFEWLAGWVVIEREMLDDIPFMTTFLQSRMLISLKKAENALILNGTQNVPGFQQVASPYNGAGYANAVDRSLDAALGQIPDATSDYYMGTDIVVRRRDLVQKFMLNKASGSGEYNLPTDAVRYDASGNVSIGNLRVTGTTDMAFNTFYAFDRNTTAFIRRMQPELRLFEDATLAKRNKLMWRIEERATLVIFRNDAIVKGVLTQSA